MRIQRDALSQCQNSAFARHVSKLSSPDGFYAPAEWDSRCHVRTVRSHSRPPPLTFFDENLPHFQPTTPAIVCLMHAMRVSQGRHCRTGRRFPTSGQHLPADTLRHPGSCSDVVPLTRHGGKNHPVNRPSHASNHSGRRVDFFRSAHASAGVRP